MKTKVYDIINMDTVKKGIKFLNKNNDLPYREIEIPDYITPEMIKKAVKRLMKHKIKPDKDGLITIENPIERGDPLEGIISMKSNYTEGICGVRFIEKED